MNQEPGRELDAAVAERWKEMEDAKTLPGRALDARVWLVLNDRSSGEPCRYVDGDVQPHAGYPIGHISPPAYSTDFAASWRVVKELDLFIIGFDFRDDRITCRMVSTKLGIAECTGQTEEHAICLTALALVEPK